MYKRESQLIEQYPIEITDTRKGRGALICIGETESYLLKEYQGSEQRAEFLYHILCHLKERGILAEEMIKTKEEAFLVTDVEGIRYIVTSYIEGRECDTKNREDILKAVKNLALLHTKFNAYSGEIPESIRASQRPMREVYLRHNQEMKRVYKFIFNRKEKNEFEQAFLKSFQEFYEQAREVQRQVQELGEKRVKSDTLCHGEYSQHNVLFTQRGIAVTNFEQMKVGCQIGDLGFFMRKILEKHNWNIGLGMDMIAAYNSVKKMEPEQMQELYETVAYPEKFWKIANHYTNTSKSWACGRNIEKLEKILQQEESRKQFLRMLFYFTR